MNWTMSLIILSTPGSNLTFPWPKGKSEKKFVIGDNNLKVFFNTGDKTVCKWVCCYQLCWILTVNNLVLLNSKSIMLLNKVRGASIAYGTFTIRWKQILEYWSVSLTCRYFLRWWCPTIHWNKYHIWSTSSLSQFHSINTFVIAI